MMLLDREGVVGARRELAAATAVPWPHGDGAANAALDGAPAAR